jgi:phage shock protein E
MKKAVPTMNRSTRALATLVLLGLFAACSSSSAPSSPDASSSNGKDATVSPDLAADVTGLGPDTVVSAPDARVNDAGVGKADAAMPDATAAEDAKAEPPVADALRYDDTAATPDTAGKPDAASPDLPSADEKPATPDAAKPEAPSADAVSPDLLPGADSGACAQTAFTHLSPLELKTLLDGGEDPFLINVKGTSIKNIPGTDAVLASDVPGIEALVKSDLCANIVIYCRSGATSQSVGTQLVAKGYKRVRDLAGGITAWEAAGYPTE